MSISSVVAAQASSQASAANSKAGWASLDQRDFIKLLTVQLKNQDPSAPVDNKEMLAQMAQFSSLSGINEMNTTLQSIADKIDLLTKKSL